MDDSFAALAPAVLEGQRIVNGMADILRLYLTRICTMGLLIVSSLVIGFFPLALRQGSLIVLLSVGIPTVALALWAQPGPESRDHLLANLMRFVLPPMLLTSMIGLLLFYGVYVLLVTPLHIAYWDLFIRVANPIIHGPVTNAQSTLSAFLVFTGLLLVIFVQPPTLWWTGGDKLSGDWRPTRLALGLMALFVVMELTPPLRNLFALEPLGAVEWGLVLGATVVWLFLVRFMWRARVLERLLSVKSGAQDSRDAQPV
jgi:cation-transporting ATPase E